MSKFSKAFSIQFFSSSTLSSFNKIPFLPFSITSFAHSFGVATIKQPKYIACNKVVANPHPEELG
ncbi:MAG: hypothetical protein LBD88_02240 [Candidatus Peribacteria bacterium]|nr:hypothetical protein [Candidatus Peribacteria bacterium]